MGINCDAVLDIKHGGGGGGGGGIGYWKKYSLYLRTKF